MKLHHNEFDLKLGEIQEQFKHLHEQLREERSYIKLLLEEIDEGVCFIDENLQILADYSPQLETLLGQKELAGQSFEEVLEHRIPDKLIQESMEYLRFMFRADLDEETLQELNQLEEIEFHYNGHLGLWSSSRFLTFRFKRIYRGEHIHRVMAVVKDISRLKSLEQKVAYAEEESKKQMDLMVNILHIDPPLLNEFLKSVQTELQTIDKQLKAASEDVNYPAILSEMKQAMGSIENNAGLLDLHFMTNKARQFLSDIEDIAKRRSLDGSDFVPIVLKLDEMQKMVEEIQTLMARVKQFKSTLRTTRRYENEVFLNSLTAIVTKLSRKYGKQIQLVTRRFNGFAIPYEQHQLLKEFIFTLTRLVVIYGIETPEVRKASNLNPTALIELETFTEGKLFGIRFRHNGQVIRTERMIKKTLEAQMYHDGSDPNTSIHPGSDIISLFFYPPAGNENDRARNQYDQLMNQFDVNRKKLNQNGGHVKITFTSEEFTEYNITLAQPRQKTKAQKTEKNA